MATYVIRAASPYDSAWLQTSFAEEMEFPKPGGYFAKCVQLQEEGKIILLIAESGETYLGHTKIVWESSYGFFKKNSIPEIADLNVIPRYRRQGVATRLVGEAEKIIARRSNIAGIGFGLYADYGPAQQMYVRLGYVPDGSGVMRNNRPIKPGESVVVDDKMALYLIKDLEMK